MTDLANGQGTEFQTSAPAAPVTPSSTPSQAPTDERTFRQSEVNDIASRRANEAVERYKRETSIASHSTPNQAAPSQQHQQHNGMSESEYRRLAAEEASRLRNEWVQDAQRSSQEQDAQRVAKEFLGKIEAGKSKYPDFEKKIAEIGFGNYPHVVQLANMVDNTEDVVNELAENPSKIGMIQNLVDQALRAGISPNLALMEMRKLSESLKKNQEAGKFRAPNEPLSQLRPSNAGMGNAGPLTAADYRRKYKV